MSQHTPKSKEVDEAARGRNLVRSNPNEWARRVVTATIRKAQHTPGSCGCRIKSVRFSPGNPNGQFEVIYCSLHAAAPEMLDFISTDLMNFWPDKVQAHPDVKILLAKARALLARVEGRDA